MASQRSLLINQHTSCDHCRRSSDERPHLLEKSPRNRSRDNGNLVRHARSNAQQKDRTLKN
jgi:hypothetical protein